MPLQTGASRPACSSKTPEKPLNRKIMIFYAIENSIDLNI